MGTLRATLPRPQHQYSLIHPAYGIALCQGCMLSPVLLPSPWTLLSPSALDIIMLCNKALKKKSQWLATKIIYIMNLQVTAAWLHLLDAYYMPDTLLSQDLRI